MSEGLTAVDLMLFVVAALVVLGAVYTHAEGNRVTAIRFVYDDIRREMGHHPRHKVLWRAFNIAMGWRKRSGYSKRSSKVTSLRKTA